jgi:hypothetical protein
MCKESIEKGKHPMGRRLILRKNIMVSKLTSNSHIRIPSHSFLTFILFLISISMSSPVFGTISARSSINWNTGVLQLELTSPVDSRSSNPASASTTTTAHIRRVMPQYMLSALLQIQVDSRRTVGTLVQENPDLLRTLESLASSAVPRPSRLSQDLSQVRVEFTLNLFPNLIEHFIRHQIPNPVPQQFVRQGTGVFTGIVIFAANPLPARGETIRGSQVQSILRPSVFMRIFDQDLRTIYESNMVDPMLLKKYGSAAYTSSFDETLHRDLIGNNPLRIVASEIFGITNTDIILSNEVVQVLLANNQNRQLLQEGRVLIIVNDQVLQQSLD